MEEQKPILAHELTHALQDQNYNLESWSRLGGNKIKDPTKLQIDEEEPRAARIAVIEGQAMIVYVDYILSAYGRRLENSP